jgi:hypothetical protein
MVYEHLSFTTHPTCYTYNKESIAKKASSNPAHTTAVMMKCFPVAVLATCKEVPFGIEGQSSTGACNNLTFPRRLFWKAYLHYNATHSLRSVLVKEVEKEDWTRLSAKWAAWPQ